MRASLHNMLFKQHYFFIVNLTYNLVVLKFNVTGGYYIKTIFSGISTTSLTAETDVVLYPLHLVFKYDLLFIGRVR